MFMVDESFSYLIGFACSVAMFGFLLISDF